MSEHLKKEVERLLGFPVGEPTAHRLSVTGEPYVTMTSGGVKAEGDHVAAVAFTPEKAWQMFLSEIFRYKQPLGDYVLYWRRPPDLDSWVMGEPFDRVEVTVYSYSARLLISDKPVLAEQCPA